MKTKAKLLAILLTIIVVLFTVALPESSNVVNRRTFDINNCNLKLLANSGPIHIDNNWAAAKAAGICTGTGTSSNPYIIEDLVIDGAGSENCIWIENSDVYFTIKDCTLFISEIGNNVGIKLSNTENGYINNNICSNNSMGIHLDASSNNRISRNIVINNSHGIYLDQLSNLNTISRNIVNYSSWAGIVVNNSLDNLIYLNCFNNDLNAMDEGLDNIWNGENNGNHWADYTGSDYDANGIGDTPYHIPGSAGSQDNFPLIECQVYATVEVEDPDIPILLISSTILIFVAVIAIVSELIIRFKRRIK